MKKLERTRSLTTHYSERILQIGEGNFLRAFIDWMVNEMNRKVDFNTSIVVTQPRPNGKIQNLVNQDGLFTLITKGLENGKPVRRIEQIESISRCIDPYRQYDAFKTLAENADLRFIVSNTTEAGIVYDPLCDGTEQPAVNFPARMTQFLYHRFEKFKGASDKGIIFFPCELIEQNGDCLKKSILQYVRQWKLTEAFAEWISDSCAFANTLVDRIVPGYPKDTAAEIEEELGYEDKLLVECEVYHLFVIEAPQWVQMEFPAATAGLNVIFVPSIQPYRERKVTLLNAPHTVLSPVAYLYGLNTVREACEDKIVGAFIRKVMYEELIPTLDLPQEELLSFADSVMERFLNPYVNHQVTSIMLNSFPKYKTRDLPAIKKYLQRTGKLPKALVFGLAAIICYYKGEKRGDDIVSIQDDPNTIALLTSLWSTADYGQIAQGVLGATVIWGEDLNRLPGLTQMLAEAVQTISEKGMKVALTEMVG